ncbi:MAG: HAD family hydrolase [Prochlorothrix sp.]|nr:HAD family hydrolase [Prochlorothrix sp.]
MLLNFDYDGVIADSLPALLEITQQAQVALGLGRSPQVEDFAQLENMTFADLARAIAIPEAAIDRYLAQVFTLQQRLPPPPLFPKIHSLLHTLAQEYVLAVITSSQGDAVRAALAQQGLGEVVAAVLGGELGLTKAERIVRAHRQMKVGGLAVMIGDSASDIIQGQKAGAATVAVTWGFQGRDRLLAAQPGWICDRPEELLELLLSDTIPKTCLRGHSPGPYGVS